MNSPNKTYSKLKWTPEVILYPMKEEQLLKTLKEQKNVESWKTIANQMNQIFVQKSRSGKQCRERYMNYVRFGDNTPKTLGWTQNQDHELFQKFMQHGAKWVQIGKQMEGRSENCLKNRFYGAMRKIIRKIHRTAKQKRLKQKKPIKAELLIRILEYQHNQKGSSLNQEVEAAAQFLEGLKKQMIKIAINPQQNSTFEQIQSLISGIIKFSSLTKGSGARKQSQKQSHEQSEDEVQIEDLQQLEEAESKVFGEKDRLQQAGTFAQNKPNSKEMQKFSHKRIENLILVSSIGMKESHRTQKLIGESLFQSFECLDAANQPSKLN